MEFVILSEKNENKVCYYLTVVWVLKGSAVGIGTGFSHLQGA